jgi:membrane-associated phospholipid phosphatase
MTSTLRQTKCTGAALAWGAGTLLFAWGWWVVCAGTCRVPRVDSAILALLDQQRAPLLDAVFSAITWLGSIYVLLPITVLLAWRFIRRGRERDAWFLLAALIGARALAHLLKVWVNRPRPDLFATLGPTPNDPSFPSAHAMQITATVLALLLVYEMRGSRWRVWLPALLLIFLVGLSRCYLQVHFPSDVLIGMALAASWVGGLRLLLGSHR